MANKLYDILDVKKIGNNLPSVTADFKRSSYRDGSNCLPKNSITSTKEEVNTSNYYMQDNENYSNKNNLVKEESGFYYVLNIA